MPAGTRHHLLHAVSGVLRSPISATALSMQVDLLSDPTDEGWPAPPFEVVLGDSTTRMERVTVGDVLGSVLGSLTRGGGSTDPVAHPAGEAVVLGVNRADVARLIAHITPAGFSPATLGPRMWLDAFDFGDLADGAAVTSWTDKSGFGNTVANPSSTMTKRTLGGRPVVRGIAASTESDLSKAGGPAAGTMDAADWTLAYVFKPAAGGVGHTGFFWGNPANGVQVDVEGASPNLGVQVFHNGSAAITSVYTLSETGLQVVVLTSAVADLVRSYFNGAVDDTGGPVTWDFTTTPVLFVGAYSNSAYNADWDLAELAYYPRVLSADERAQLTAYLIDRWGVT